MNEDVVQQDGMWIPQYNDQGASSYLITVVDPVHLIIYLVDITEKLWGIDSTYIFGCKVACIVHGVVFVQLNLKMIVSMSTRL